MALAGANIVGAQIYMMSNGMALDTFQLQDVAGGAGDGGKGLVGVPARPERIARLATHIEQTLSGRIRLRETFAQGRLRQLGRMFSAYRRAC